MNKILINIFYGPNNQFDKKIKNHRYFLDISTIINISEVSFLKYKLGERNEFEKFVSMSIKKPDVDSIVIYGSDYALLTEAGEKGFAKFLKDTIDATKEYSNIQKIYLQNPTKNIKNLILRFFNDDLKYKIEIEHYKYPTINDEHIKKLYENFSNIIIGQEFVKNELLKVLYYMKEKNNEKPIVLMFYGDSGIGKTETAKFLSDLLGGELLRIQMSMFQNEYSLNYLFGNDHSTDCFAKDLLERETNIILLDEFDKTPNVMVSAFYQLFDEGIYEDRNYKVDLKNTIIICTSNYHNENEIMKSLGEPMFYRFNKLIYFNNLSQENFYKICNIIYEHEKRSLSKDDKKIIDKYDDKLKNIFSKKVKEKNNFENYNFRNIKNNIVDIIQTILVKEFIKDNYL